MPGAIGASLLDWTLVPGGLLVIFLIYPGVTQLDHQYGLGFVRCANNGVLG